MPERTQPNGNGTKKSTPDHAANNEVRARDSKTDYHEQVADQNDDSDKPLADQGDVKKRQQHHDRTGTHDRDSDFNQQGSYQGEYRHQEATNHTAKHPDDANTGYPEGEYEGGDQGSKGDRKRKHD